MKILIAPDKFKGSLKASEVAEAIRRGIRKVNPDAETVAFPVVDGGEGTVEALVVATGGQKASVKVTGPLGAPVESFFGLLGPTALEPACSRRAGRADLQGKPKALDSGLWAAVEMAAASGLALVPPEKRNPMVTTTYGTGELIKAALDTGSRQIMVGIGDSATVDGGTGMAQALGAEILDENGTQVGFGGGELLKVSRINLSGIDSRLREAEVLVACDVDNPLIGPQGAASVYGPQKGATPEQVAELEKGLANLATVIRKNLGVDVLKLSGAGAAGGLGAGLVAFLRAKLRSGLELIMGVAGLKEKLAGVDLVITGEGKMDSQTLRGKAPAGVSRAAKEAGIPVVAIVGQAGPGFEEVYRHGISQVHSLMEMVSTEEEAMNRAAELVEAAAEEVMKNFLKSED